MDTSLFILEFVVTRGINWVDLYPSVILQKGFMVWKMVPELLAK